VVLFAVTWFGIRYADNMVPKHCSVKWGDKRPDYFTHALVAEAVTGLDLTGFAGEAAHPERGADVVVR